MIEGCQKRLARPEAQDARGFRAGDLPIYCDCHGTERLATLRGTTLIITDTRHGYRHYVVIPLDKLCIVKAT